MTTESSSSTATAAPGVPSFAELNFGPELARALADLGFDAPTPVQSQAIPPLRSGRDVVVRAQTGTGKTAAFALPVLEKLRPGDGSVQALVLVPTRELAVQVAAAIQGFAQHMPGVRAVPIYGGEVISKQFYALRGAAQIVVGTPGRVIDHLERGSLRLDNVSMAVLDEADEMLRMGFAEDVESILQRVPTERQMVLCSATMPEEIARIAKQYLRNPFVVEVAQSTRTALTVEQRYVVVPLEKKVEALARVLACEEFAAALVFARTRVFCAELAELLAERGIAAEAMHGDLAQSARDAVLRRLRHGQLRVLVATDVAARGLDVDLIDLVVNVETPDSADTYVHRIGRTGRAGRAGKAILFLTPRQERRLRELERFTGQPMVHLPLPTLEEVERARVNRFVSAVQRQFGRDDLVPFRQVAEELWKNPHPDLAAGLVALAWGDRPPPIWSEPGPAPTPYRQPAPLAAPPPRPFQPATRAAPRAPMPPPPAAAPRPVAPAYVAPAYVAPAYVAPPQPVAPVYVAPPQAVAPAPVAPKRTVAPVAPAPVAPVQVAPPPPQYPVPDNRLPAAPLGRVWLSLGVGKRNHVESSELIDAICQNADIAPSMVGELQIRDTYTLADIDAGAAAACMARLVKVRVKTRFLNPRLLEGDPEPETESAPRKPRPIKQEFSQPPGTERPKRAKRPPA